MTLEEVLSRLDRIAPFHYALPWDNSGLQIGDPRQEISSALLSLEVTRSVVDEAIHRKAHLIITHHPLIFTPLKSILLNRYPGGIISRLLKEGLALVAMHTNWDAAPGGLSDLLAEKVNLQVEGPLEPSAQGEGGIGRVGNLPRPRTLEELATELMSLLPGSWARIAGSPQRKVQRVAVCPGSGGDLWPKARELGAQALITGDVKYHQARESLEEGMAILDLGHFATEAWGMGILAERVRGEIPSLEIALEGSLKDPFITYTKGGSP